jgi:chromosome partitioning protein
LSGVEDIFEFGINQIHSAISKQDAKPFITKVNDNIDVLAGSEMINILHKFMYREYWPRDYSQLLNIAIADIKGNYDYIIIDMPPAIGEISYIALTSADYIIPMFETSKFCYSSLESFFESIRHVQKNLNPKLKVAGVLRTMIDKRRSDNKYYSDLVGETYGDQCFKTIISRTAVVGRVPSYGILENPEIKQIEKQYTPIYKELMKIVEATK